MSIQAELNAVLLRVAQARREPLKDHALAARLKQDLASEIRAVVNDPTYKVEGSPGKGNWAETVWVLVFDPLVTETAQEGFYVVYLIPEMAAGSGCRLIKARRKSCGSRGVVVTERSWPIRRHVTLGSCVLKIWKGFPPAQSSSAEARI